MKRRSVRRLVGAACVVTIVVGVGAGTAARRRGVSGVANERSVPYSTWIESRASRAFDPATPQLRGLHVGYRVDAHVLLPLGFTSVELWQKPGVGTVTASYRDCASDAGDIVRAFELFSSSDPERAHGFDRRGFFREALQVTPSGVAWTAYFGVMTSWPEKTLSEARKSADGPQPHTYDAIDGLSTPLETRSSVFQVATEGRLTDSGAFWAAIRPQLDTHSPRSVLAQDGSPVKPLPSLAFLGALQVSLRSAAAHRGHPLASSATRVAFTHNGLVRQLELSSMAPAPRRGQAAVAAGLAHNAADVFELRYRIVNPGFEAGEFRLWAELPAGTRDTALTPPLPPLGWEMQLRSYLKLVFERTS
jgi:hypothetical protein